MTLEYRLYYDSLGRVITYTTESLPGNYLIISREQYAEANPNIMIVNNQIANKSTRLVSKVTKNLEHGIETSKYDVNVIVKDDPHSVYWATEIYAIN